MSVNVSDPLSVVVTVGVSVTATVHDILLGIVIGNAPQVAPLEVPLTV